MFSAEHLLLDLHGQLLREAARSTGVHFQGLSQAARFLGKRNLIDGRTVKKFREVDAAFGIIRHITAVSRDTLVMCVIDQLANADSNTDVDADVAAETAEVADVTDACSGETAEVADVIDAGAVDADSTTYVADYALASAAIPVKFYEDLEDKARQRLNDEAAFDTFINESSDADTTICESEPTLSPVDACIAACIAAEEGLEDILCSVSKMLGSPAFKHSVLDKVVQAIELSLRPMQMFLDNPGLVSHSDKSRVRHYVSRFQAFATQAESLRLQAALL